MSGPPPQLRPDLDPAGFWAALSAGRLAVCRCTGCRRWLQPLIERGRRCGLPTAFEDVSGRGTVYSYTVVRHPAVAGYKEELPYTLALVELDEQEGLRLPARLVDVEPADVRVDWRSRRGLPLCPAGATRWRCSGPSLAADGHGPLPGRARRRVERTGR